MKTISRPSLYYAVLVVYKLSYWPFRLFFKKKPITHNPHRGREDCLKRPYLLVTKYMLYHTLHMLSKKIFFQLSTNNYLMALRQ